MLPGRDLRPATRTLPKGEVFDGLALVLSPPTALVRFFIRHAPQCGHRSSVGFGLGAEDFRPVFAKELTLVTGVDIDEGLLLVARKRCDAFGVRAETVAANTADAGRVFAGAKFDFVIFYASLEHMTIDERLRAITDTWGADASLPEKGARCQFSRTAPRTRRARFFSGRQLQA